MQSYNYIVTINYRTPKGRSSYYTWEGPALGFNDAIWWTNVFLRTERKRKCKEVIHTSIQALMD
jgi:hypothetical protein